MFVPAATPTSGTNVGVSNNQHGVSPLSTLIMGNTHQHQHQQHHHHIDGPDAVNATYISVVSYMKSICHAISVSECCSGSKCCLFIVSMCNFLNNVVDCMMNYCVCYEILCCHLFYIINLSLIFMLFSCSSPIVLLCRYCLHNRLLLSNLW